MTLPELLQTGSQLLWYLLLPVAGVWLLIAIVGKHTGDGVACARCKYNRHGLSPDKDCPECGAAGKPKNVKYGHRLRSRRRIVARGCLIVCIIALAVAASGIATYLENTNQRFRDALAAKDHPTIVQMLKRHPELARGEDPYDYIKLYDSPLRVPIELQDHATIQTLLNAGSDPNHEVHGFGPSFLTTAVRQDDIKTVEMLLDAGADPNLSSMSGLSFHALLDAVAHASLQTIELLLERGADPNLSYLWSTPLIRAQYRPDAELVTRLLLDHGADPNGTGEIEESPAIYLAVSRRHVESLRLLLEAGATIDDPKGLLARLGDTEQCDYTEEVQQIHSLIEAHTLPQPD